LTILPKTQLSTMRICESKLPVGFAKRLKPRWNITEQNTGAEEISKSPKRRPAFAVLQDMMSMLLIGLALTSDLRRRRPRQFQQIDVAVDGFGD
jgi:hypothetical protein